MILVLTRSCRVDYFTQCDFSTCIVTDSNNL